MAELSLAQWDAVQAAYVVGIESVRAIGERFGVSHTAIQKRAKSEGWMRANGKKVQAMIDSMAEAEAGGLPTVAKLPALATELDRLASLKIKSERNAELLADKLPVMLANIETMQELQQAAKAHRDLHETHFGKGTPDVQINQQFNAADTIKGFEVVK